MKASGKKATTAANPSKLDAFLRKNSKIFIAVGAAFAVGLVVGFVPGSSVENSPKFKELSSHSESIEASLAEREAELKNLEGELKALESESESLRQSVGTLDQKLADQSEAIEGVAAIEAELKESKSELAEVGAELASAQAALGDAQAELESVLAENSVLASQAQAQTSSPLAAPAGDSSVYYKNCDAARAAGAAPIYEGQPGYRAGLDRDKDGVACE